MRIGAFLADRLGFMTLYLLQTLLIVTVIQLDLLGRQLSLDSGSLWYIAILSLSGLSVFLLLDYSRQRGYFQIMTRLSAGHPEPAALEGLSVVPSGITREQRLVRQVLEQLYGAYTSRLNGYRAAQERHQLFVKQWVHQMKTPVSVIDLLTQPFADEPPLQAAALERLTSRSVLDSIQEETERLVHGLEMMLHTARLDKFELDVRVRRVDLLQAVRRAVGRHKKACIRLRIYPKLITSLETCPVDTDEKWLDIILDQIMTNAIKYAKPFPSENKALVITVRAADDGSEVVFRDEGIGIAEQDLPRVFEPFFTGENGRAVRESTGMGLYIAREACLRLGHRIEIESQLGTGTTVRLRLPGGRTLHDGLMNGTSSRPV